MTESLLGSTSFPCLPEFLCRTDSTFACARVVPWTLRVADSFVSGKFLGTLEVYVVHTFFGTLIRRVVTDRRHVLRPLESVEAEVY